MTSSAHKVTPDAGVPDRDSTSEACVAVAGATNELEICDQVVAVTLIDPVDVETRVFDALYQATFMLTVVAMLARKYPSVLYVFPAVIGSFSDVMDVATLPVATSLPEATPVLC
jgi:hypothetical protein